MSLKILYATVNLCRLRNFQLYVLFLLPFTSFSARSSLFKLFQSPEPQNGPLRHHGTNVPTEDRRDEGKGLRTSIDTVLTQVRPQEDEYWILRYRKDNQFSDSINGTYYEGVQPVTDVSADLGGYREAPDIAQKALGFAEMGLDEKLLLVRKHVTDWENERWIGRRVNDEVELFDFEGDGEEFAELRKDLERMGLTVRSYKPQVDPPNKFPKPTYKAAMGGEKNALINKVMKNLEKGIAEWYESTGVRFGMLVDYPDAKVKTLGIIRLDEDVFLDLQAKDDATIDVRDSLGIQEYTCKVIGEIRDGVPKFYCSEDETKAYFNSVGEMKTFMVRDFVKTRQAAEALALKEQKKQAKKHRRQLTASTSASTPASENSFAFLPSQDSDEAVRARQREKNNAKRKAQKERRKASAAEEALRRDSCKDMEVIEKLSLGDESSSSGDGDSNRGGGPQIIFMNETKGLDKVLQATLGIAMGMGKENSLKFLDNRF
ncbi:hypothetical protein LTR37_008346 [Vermiconidia calcicola]|uniref:Uncharacterized protein n=1 Tax=Vermiconidia calcicola TaxID=1690605 RepID=A0ACC3NAX9_9PEZI|nr:hypothetical protein LTR37_008346 [Vermiconidia calcicola]